MAAPPKIEWATYDIKTMLGVVKRVAKERDELRAEVERLREVLNKFLAALDECQAIMKGEYGQVEFDLIEAARAAYRATLNEGTTNE